MSGFFGSSTNDDADENDNPGGNANTDAGDLGTRNAAEVAARADYESSVGSDGHAQEVGDARSDSGFDDAPAQED